MRRRVAPLAVFVGLAATAVTSPAAACVNATISDSDGVKKLREAERALDEGDVATARDLAGEVRMLTTESPGGTGRALHEHATRVLATAYVRDPEARPVELGRAVEILESQIAEIRQQPEGFGRYVSPALEADLGEAYERAGKDDDALRVLVPLADKDLIGSAHAWAALGRAAKRHGDGARATSAEARCAAVAASPAACRGEYPKPPLLRGGPLGYVSAGLVWLGALLLRIAPRRRERRAPWLGHAPRTFAVLALAGGLLTLGAARYGWAVGLLAAVLAYLLAAAQRLAFVRAVRGGKVEGFHLRPIEPGDEALPLHQLAFDGTASGETLEHLPTPDYRATARVPLARLRRQRIPGWFIGLVLGLFFLGTCAAFVSLTVRGVP